MCIPKHNSLIVPLQLCDWNSKCPIAYVNALHLSPIAEHLSRLQVGAVNMPVQVPLRLGSPLGAHREAMDKEMWWAWGRMWNFTRYQVFPNGCTNKLNKRTDWEMKQTKKGPYQHAPRPTAYGGGCTTPCSCQTSIRAPCFLVSKWNHTAVLICISVTTNEIKLLFISVLSFTFPFLLNFLNLFFWFSYIFWTVDFYQFYVSSPIL